MAGNNREQDRRLYSEQQIRSAFAASGITIWSETARHFIVFCPYHDNFNTPSGEVDKELGLFYCFSCNSTTDLIHFISKCTGWTWFRARRTIGEYDYNIVEAIDAIFEDPCVQEFDQSIVDRLHSDVDGGREYFNSRNITDASIERFELGYSHKQNMVVVPIHSPNGTLMGFVGRSIIGKKFKNTKGMSKAKLLFNMHRVIDSTRVFVVESSFDAIRLDQVGMPSVATLGAGISHDQLDLLRGGFDDIVLVPDNDQAGDVMQKKLLDYIPYAQVLRIEGLHDVGDLTDDQIRGMV